MIITPPEPEPNDELTRHWAKDTATTAASRCARLDAASTSVGRLIRGRRHEARRGRGFGIDPRGR